MVTLISNDEHKAFTTLSRAKVFLQKTGTTTYDTMITLLINMATEFIERETNRNLLSQTYTNEEYDGTDSPELILKQSPVNALTRLQVNNAGDNSDSWETINSIRYFFYADGRIRMNSARGDFLDVDAGVFIGAEKKYRATYTAGYLIDFDNENDPSLHTLPGDIEYACLKLVAEMFNTGGVTGLESTRVGDISMKLRTVTKQDPIVSEIIGRYTKYSFGGAF